LSERVVAAVGGTSTVACDELSLNDRMLSAALAYSRAHGSMMAVATASMLRATSALGPGAAR